MPHLRIVGLDDAGRLLLRGEDGQEHTVSIDDELEAALRRGRPGTGQVESNMEALRPREIQARVRSGESPESVASAAGVDLDRVERFARPVLQEREHVADVARQVVVRAGGVEAPLAELVDHRLAHLDGHEREWDAWRRDDGRWTVELRFSDGSGPRTARWSFDPHTRSVAVDDDTARAITEGGTVAAPAAPPEQAPEVPAPAPARRLLSVPDLVDDADGDSADDLADELAALGLQPVDDTPAAPSAPVATDDDTPLTLDLDAGRTTRPEPPAAPPAEASEPVADEQPAAQKKPAKKTARKKSSKRASVPSWDDIVFGSRKPE